MLQRIDGLELEDVWSLNRTVIVPDLTVYLCGSAATIRRRIDSRSQLTRLELAGGPTAEIDLYGQALAFLDRMGWTQRILDTDLRTVESIVAEIEAVVS